MAANLFGATALITPSQIDSQPVEDQSAVKEKYCHTKECVLGWINIYSKRYGVNEKLAKSIARCESEFKADVYGDGGKAYGTFQFHKPTFELFAKKFGDENLDYLNPEHNVKLAIWALADGKGYHWTCYDKALKSLGK